MASGQQRTEPAEGIADTVNMGTVSGSERTPYAVAARELLRNTLLDCARDELERRSWSQISMAEVARAAGVSRQTLYKEFGTRDEFAQALVLREGERFLLEVERAVAENLADPIAALSAAFEVFLTAAAENPLVRTIVLEDGTADLLPLVTTHGAPIVRYATGRLTDIINGGWPQVHIRDSELLSECLVRMAISYAALPDESPSATSASVMRLLRPFVENMLASISKEHCNR